MNLFPSISRSYKDNLEFEDMDGTFMQPFLGVKVVWSRLLISEIQNLGLESMWMVYKILFMLTIDNNGYFEEKKKNENLFRL